MYRFVVVLFLGAQDNPGKVVLIYRVGKVHGLQADAGVFAVVDAVFADHIPQLVGGVQLQPGLGGVDLHGAAGLGVVQDGCRAQSGFGFGQDIAVVVAAGNQLDITADRVGAGKIHGGAVGFQDVAHRDGVVIYRQVFFGVNAQLVIEDGAVAAQIPVGVVGKVDRGRFGGFGTVADSQLVAVVQGVGYLYIELAGVPLLAVGTGAREGHAYLVAVAKDPGCPDYLVKPVAAAMQMVAAVVTLQGKGARADGELRLADAPGDPPDGGPEIRVGLEIVIETVEAKYQIAQFAVAAGHLEGHQGSPVGHTLQGNPAAVGDGNDIYRGSIERGTESVFCYFHDLGQQYAKPGGVSNRCPNRAKRAGLGDG